jgi:hypothetical protein
MTSKSLETVARFGEDNKKSTKKLRAVKIQGTLVNNPLSFRLVSKKHKY